VQAEFEIKLAELDVGVDVGPITTEDFQSREVDPLTSGNTNFDVTQGETLEARLPIRLRPHIYKYNQLITVKQLDHISVVLSDNIFLFQNARIYHIDPMHEFDFTRVVGVHVENYYIQQEMDIKFTLFSTLQLDVPITQAILGIPEIARGDFVWDLAITGDTGVSVVLVDDTAGIVDWFENLFGGFGEIIAWIVGIAVIGVILFVVVKATPLVTKGVQMKQDKEDRERKSGRRVTKR